MEGILKKIYEEVIRNEEDVVMAEIKLDKKIKDVMEALGNAHGGNEEELRDCLAKVSAEAGYLGFCTGARYAVRIMAEIFAGEPG